MHKQHACGVERFANNREVFARKCALEIGLQRAFETDRRTSMLVPSRDSATHGVRRPAGNAAKSRSRPRVIGTDLRAEPFPD